LVFEQLLLAQLSAAPEPRAAANEKNAKVYIAGVGPTPHIQAVLDDLTDFLVSKKVPAKQLANSEGKTRNELAARVKERGGESLLYLSLDIGSGQSDTLKAQCVNAEGERLWEEEATGPMVATSYGSAVKSMTKKMTKKLDSRIGKSGLPVDE
jgi:hypothetical protein